MNKTSVSQFALYGFYAVSIANLYAQVMQLELVDMITKPLLMVTLLLHYLTARSRPMNKLSWLIVGAVLFSWFGDILLMLKNPVADTFVFGLGAFLIAQVFYIVAYHNAKYKNTEVAIGRFVAFRMAFLIIYGGSLVFILRENIGDLFLPVAIYTATLMTMGIFGLLRKARTTDKSFLMVYSGALLFIMSDSILAIARFSHPLVQSGLLVMATYIAAQFLIAKGLLAHEQSTEQES